MDLALILVRLLILWISRKLRFERQNSMHMLSYFSQFRFLNNDYERFLCCYVLFHFYFSGVVTPSVCKTAFQGAFNDCIITLTFLVFKNITCSVAEKCI